MRLANDLAVVRDRIRRDGWSFTLRRVREIVRERLIQPWEHLYWMPTNAVVVIEPPTDARLEVVLRVEDLSDERWRELEEHLGSDTVPRLRERIERGCEMHILTLKGQIAGTRFVVWGRTHAFQHVPLTENDTMGMDVRIDPEYRGRRLAPLFFSLSIQDLARRGCERVWAVVAVHNVRSVKTLERVGFRRLLTQRIERGRYRYDRDIVK